MKFDAEDYNGIYSHPDILFQVWAYTVTGAVFLFVGFTLSFVVYDKRRNVKKIHQKIDKLPVEPSAYDVSKTNFRWILGLFGLSVLVLLLYRNEIGGFPLENIFSGLSGAELGLLRSDATNGFEGHLYRYVMFMEVIPTFIFIYVSLVKDGVASKKWKSLYCLLLIYNILYALITLQKAPLIFLFILCYIIYTYKRGEIKKKPLILVGLVSAFMIIIMYVFFMGISQDTPVSEILGGALHRIFISSIMPFYWYIKFINEHGFFLGTTFPNPAGILPFEHFNLAVEIMDYSKGFRGEAVGSMPTVFIGEMYANFGIIGILFSSITFGFFLQSLDIYFWQKMNKKKTLLLSSLYLWLIFKLHIYAVTSITGIIVDTDYYIIGLLAFWFVTKKNKYNKQISLKSLRKK